MHKSITVLVQSFIISFILLFGIGVLWVTSLPRPAVLPAQQTDVPVQTVYSPGKDECLNLLVVLCQKRNQSPDRFFLLQLNAVKNAVTIAEIPATLDATVQVQTDSLTELYEYGGIDLAKKGIENLFFIQVDRGVRLDDAGVAELVDMLGGMEWEPSEEAVYSTAAGEEIRLPPERQTIDGRRFCVLLRSQGVEAICSLAEQRMDAGFCGKLESFLQTFGEVADTDLTAYDLEYYRKGWEQMMRDHSCTCILPTVTCLQAGERNTVSDETKEAFQAGYAKE